MEALLSSIPSDFLNQEMFQQLLELEGDDPGFLAEIVKTYVAQGESTLLALEQNLENKNIEEISRLGHLLKGASAALGLSLLAKTCERIQYLGKCKDETRDITVNEAFERIKTEIQLAILQFQMAKEFLSRL